MKINNLDLDKCFWTMTKITLFLSTILRVWKKSSHLMWLKESEGEHGEPRLNYWQQNAQMTTSSLSLIVQPTDIQYRLPCPLSYLNYLRRTPKLNGLTGKSRTYWYHLEIKRWLYLSLRPCYSWLDNRASREHRYSIYTYIHTEFRFVKFSYQFD